MRTRSWRAAAWVATALLAGGLVPLHQASAGMGSPAPSSGIVPLDPVRILDTRAAIGAPRTTPLAPDEVIVLQVAGVAGVPAEAVGVVLNLTVNGAAGAGYVSAYPAGSPRPNASVINYTAGEDVANMITASLGAGGALELYNAQQTVHLIADVAGYLVPEEPAPPASTGLSIDYEAPRPPTGTADWVDVGSIDGLTFSVRCDPSPGGAGLRLTTADAPFLLSGMSSAANTGPDANEVSNHHSVNGGSMTLLTTDYRNLVGTLRLPTGRMAQIALTYGALNSVTCVAFGTVLPL